MINLGTTLNSMNASVGQQVSASRAKSTVEPIQGRSSAEATRSLDRSGERKFSDELSARAPTSKPDLQGPSNVTSEADHASDASTNQRRDSDSVEASSSGTSTEVATVARQAALAVFLDRMETKLGVPAEDILEAFSNLSAQDLMAPPEESAEALISRLGLNAEDSEQALGFYNEMLAVAAAGGMAQNLMKNNQTADIQVLDKGEYRLRELRSSIGDMSDRFFMTGLHAPDRSALHSQEKLAQAYGQMQTPDSRFETEDSLRMGVPTSTGLGEGKIDVSDIPTTDGLNWNGDLDSNFDVAKMNVPTEVNSEGATIDGNLSTEVPALDVKTSPAVQASPFSFESPADIDNPEAERLNSFDPASVRGESFDASPDVAMIRGDSANVASDDRNPDNSEYADGNEAMLRDGTAGTTKSGQNEFHINAPKAHVGDVQANVKEVISQARFLADKGGGEMKVALNPEGLGEVSLKVKMVKGQVNVEMVTSNDEAKKVLEKGLSELKESLASHKLNLDTIRIENAKDISQHLDQQQKDLERSFQQKFLSDFRDQHGSFKREMYEFGAPSVPASQTRDRAVNAVYDPTKRRPPGEGRRLDLVA